MLHKKHTKRYAAMLLAAFALGGIPALFNFAVDPYRMHGWFDLGLEKKKVAVKRHGQLYKAIEYRRQPSPYLVLGDSRSRALRDKLFHELDFGEMYNFAYGGGTLPEMVSSFWYAAERQQLKGVVLGVPLRIFHEKYKGGKNQFEEAVAILDAPLRYYGNSFVMDTGLRVLGVDVPTRESILARLPRFFGHAKAKELSLRQQYKQCRRQCASDAEAMGLLLQSTPQPAATPRVVVDTAKRIEAPRAWRKMTAKASRSDWKSFVYSEAYFREIQRVVEYCRKNGIEVLFFIPPTPVTTQRGIDEYGRRDIDLAHRKRLAALAPVMDFDFPNEETADAGNFSDAFHFKGPVAKQITGEITLFFKQSGKPHDLSLKRRKSLRCPLKATDTHSVAVPGSLPVQIGRNCVMWGAS